MRHFNCHISQSIFKVLIFFFKKKSIKHFLTSIFLHNLASLSIAILSGTFVGSFQVQFKMLILTLTWLGTKVYSELSSPISINLLKETDSSLLCISGKLGRQKPRWLLHYEINFHVISDWFPFCSPSGRFFRLTCFRKSLVAV